MQHPTRLILIEGLPGSGKTSLAEWLCARLQADGSNAVWIPELQRDDLQHELLRRKGEDIDSRIAAYSSTTPYAVTRGLQGLSALVSLYAAYRETCDRLVRRARMPVLEMDAVRCSEAVVRDRVAPWVAAAITS